MKKLYIIIMYMTCALNLFAQDKIHVHTDKSCYLAGDTVWFRAYILDPETNHPTSRSKFLYLELIDNKTEETVARIKVKEERGIFANAMPLPHSLPAGAYTLAAYTRWQRNFGEATFFKKLLRIVK